MRLGMDALVITQLKRRRLLSVGFLSQTFNNVGFLVLAVAVLAAVLCGLLCCDIM